VVFESGDVLELGESSAEITATEFVGRTSSIRATNTSKIWSCATEALSYDGIVVAIVAIQSKSGELEFRT